MATDAAPQADGAPERDAAADAAAPGASGKAAAAGASTQPWIEKYRPRTLDDVAAHKDIIDTS
jgi:hypothetical protein